MVVRMFVIAAILVAAFTIVVDDKMHILSSVTPMHAALAIIAIGITGFAVKLQLWRLEQAANVSSGHEPSEPQEACSGAVSYTHLRAHETVLDLVCRLLLDL